MLTILLRPQWVDPVAMCALKPSDLRTFEATVTFWNISLHKLWKYIMKIHNHSLWLQNINPCCAGVFFVLCMQQHYVCWCPDACWCQAISRHNVDFAKMQTFQWCIPQSNIQASVELTKQGVLLACRLGPLYEQGLILIPAWISNYIHNKMWHAITYPLPNFNGATIEVWELISNLISHFTGHVITSKFQWKMHFKMSSVKWRLFRLGLNVLKNGCWDLTKLTGLQRVIIRNDLSFIFRTSTASAVCRLQL